MIKNFHLSKHNLPNFISKVTQLVETGDYVANVTERKSKRSQNANALYWEFVTQFGNHFGYDKDFSHDILRYKFLYEITEIDGESHKRLLSTAKLNTAEMAAYMENCLRYAAENGFYFESLS